MLEKIHYGIATLCGVSIVGVVLAAEKPLDWLTSAMVIIGIYLISKVLLIVKK